MGRPKSKDLRIFLGLRLKTSLVQIAKQQNDLYDTKMFRVYVEHLIENDVNNYKSN